MSIPYNIRLEIRVSSEKKKTVLQKMRNFDNREKCEKFRFKLFREKMLNFLEVENAKISRNF